MSILTAYDAETKRSDDVEAGRTYGVTTSSQPPAPQSASAPAAEQWTGNSFFDKSIQLAFIRKVVTKV